MGASKGPQYERDTCRRLSKWWSGDDSELLFWRTAQSGGHATTRGKSGKVTAGQHADIRALSDVGKPFTDLFTIELKKGYPKTRISDLLDKPLGCPVPDDSYEGWLTKLIATQKATGTPYWLLITKRDRRESVVLMPSKFYEEAALMGAGWRVGSPYPFLSIAAIVADTPIMIYGMQLESFLTMLTPEIVKKLAKERK